MRVIEIKNSGLEGFLKQLNVFLEGELQERWGEYMLEFNNRNGKGTVKGISFDWGVSMVEYDVRFTENVKIVWKIEKDAPIEFIFISEGNLEYCDGSDQEGGNAWRLEKYQNIIIAPQSFSKKTFVFPKQVAIKVNFIHIVKKEYNKKRNHNIRYLDEVLSSVFRDIDSKTPYAHYGNFSLKIADKVKELREVENSGVVRTLSLEGRLNLILAMQLLEHRNFEERLNLPEVLSREDIKKVHGLTDYIFDNISEPMSIKVLANRSGLSPKKLQSGFRVLYAQSVHDYIKKIKLEIARDYLQNTDLTVSEICYKIGIRSRSYFSKIFTEKYGLLPSECRKRLKKNY